MLDHRPTEQRRKWFARKAHGAKARGNYRDDSLTHLIYRKLQKQA